MDRMTVGDLIRNGKSNAVSQATKENKSEKYEKGLGINCVMRLR